MTDKKVKLDNKMCSLAATVWSANLLIQADTHWLYEYFDDKTADLIADRIKAIGGALSEHRLVDSDSLVLLMKTLNSPSR